MISVVLATYNEENNIARCLDSVKKLADELIVVDGSSTDRTAEIALSYGANVINTTNKSNFHINKQMAMDKAQGGIVLQLDADEVIDEELSAFIKKTHDKQQKGQLNQISAWYLKRKNYFLSKYLTKGGQYPDPVIRLYVNGKAKLPQENVHEQMTVDGEIGIADGHLLHYPYPNFSSYMRKFNTYTSFEAERLATKGFAINGSNTFKYLVYKPLQTFFLLFLRHKGFVDGMAGFIFAFMSSLHHPFVYLKYKERTET